MNSGCQDCPAVTLNHLVSFPLLGLRLGAYQAILTYSSLSYSCIKERARPISSHTQSLSMSVSRLFRHPDSRRMTGTSYTSSRKCPDLRLLDSEVSEGCYTSLAWHNSICVMKTPQLGVPFLPHILRTAHPFPPWLLRNQPGLCLRDLYEAHTPLCHSAFWARTLLRVPATLSVCLSVTLHFLPKRTIHLSVSRKTPPGDHS